MNNSWKPSGDMGMLAVLTDVNSVATNLTWSTHSDVFMSVSMFTCKVRNSNYCL